MLNLLKEVGRIILLAVVSWLLTEGVLDVVLNAFGVDLSPEIKLAIIGISTTVLKGIDRQLHELGKEFGSDSLVKGLTRF